MIKYLNAVNHYHAGYFQIFVDFSYMHLFMNRVENSVHPDQLASEPNDLDLHRLQNRIYQFSAL